MAEREAFVDLFDTSGTLVGVAQKADLLDKDGNPPRTRQILIIDSLAAVAGGVGGVSSNTSYVESASGVAEGARTGLASVVTGILFLLAPFLSPLVSVVPYEAATPALVVVGFLMMQQVTGIEWDRLDIAVPAFLTIVVMPFTYSIANGIGVGFISFALMSTFAGKAKDVHWIMWLLAGLFVIFFGMDPISNAIG